ncbi:MAG: sigma-54-dependent Fis family transcriptional regulator [candidate division Zixibacteria bacterium]|nr:sigma-54-dependent Fis family transcriptional regulator [candidate division Zixibacteria bacterium]
MASLRLLIVDDESNQREMLGGYLKRLGYSIQTAESGEAALKLLESKAFEIGLFDMKMAGISGLELFQKVHAQDPEMQVIMITAFGNVESAVEAMRAGVFDYISKPVNLEELQELIRKAGERHYLLAENRRLREHLESIEAPEIVGVSAKIKSLLSELARVAPTDATVLITGESGTGKELLARTIHRLSPRRENRFVAVSCAAIPETLLESELLGHEKGAFTGAEKRRLGRFELASGGTLLLDEIGELPVAIQVKLLRLLEERKFERLGGEEEVTADVRLIAATNRNLQDEVKAGRFREDLFFRINVVHIHIPPLRERREDIMPLVEHFLKLTGARLNRPMKRLTPAAKDLLVGAEWPGNIRELANVIERAIVLARGEVLDVDDFPQLRDTVSAGGTGAIPLNLTLRDLEKQHILNVLAANEYSLQKSADVLGIHRNTLRQKMKEYGIEKPDGE